MYLSWTCLVSITFLTGNGILTDFYIFGTSEKNFVKKSASWRCLRNRQIRGRVERGDR